jgi:hypothetical protein
MALTNRVFPPYEFREFPKEVKGKVVYSQVEEDELLGVGSEEEEDDGLDHSEDEEGDESEETKEALQAKADELGVKYRPTWGIMRLRQAIKEAKE